MSVANSTNETLQEYLTGATEVTETWIGELVWYSMHDVSVPHSALVKALAGVDDIVLPPRPADHDVFRRVSSAMKARRIESSNVDQYYNYMLREFADSQRITRRIVRETVDPKGKRLSYEPMLDVVYSRPAVKDQPGHASVHMIPGVQPDAFSSQMAHNTVKEFKEKRGTINAQGIREWIRHYLIEQGAVNVKGRSGGLYFVPQANTGMLAVLEVLSDTMNQSVGAGTIDYHSLPLVDTKRQRAMIRRAFEADTTSAIDTMMDEITKILKSGSKISEKRYGAILAEYQRLSSRSIEYKELLDDALSETETRVDWFKAQVLALTDRIDHKD